MLLIDAADQFFVSLLLFRCCNQRLLTELLSSIADAPTVAADRSTVVVAATGVKRIDRLHRLINAVDLELRGSVINNSTVSLLFCRYCPNSIAHADAPAVAVDRFTTVVAAIAAINPAEHLLLIRWNMKTMTNRSIDAADRLPPVC
mmetsp:Transcript_10934/g.24845  ORF Transcript_10934/g.24845 Transcript_10934/m.24845 type:complete len:146 (-) Transcript_10934:136-573(-)